MKTTACLKAFDELEEIDAVPLRYGEAASYRSSHWFHQGSSGNEWLADKSRNVWPFTRLYTVINESRSLLQLPDDWDEEGSSAIDPKAWERATHLIKWHAALLWARQGMILPTPRILPGPDGSIDIHWRTESRELLLNVPIDAAEPASYYGDDFGSDSRKGTLEPGAVDMGLFSWLTLTD